MLGKSKGLMGVDISSTGIKVMELKKTRSGYHLKSMGMAPVPRDAIVDNQIMDSVAVAEALTAAVQSSGSTARKVAFSISGNAAIIKTITMPFTTEFELESLIEYEADQYIPYDMDEVFLDFHIMGMSADDPSQMEVVLAACKREIIEDYQLVLNEAGLTVACVDCAVFTLENASEICLQDPKESKSKKKKKEDDMEPEDVRVHALVNIGANLININILKNDEMSFVRDQFYGGKNLTEAIEKAHHLSYQDAESMKLEHFSDVDPEVITSFYEELGGQLMRTLDVYAANNSEHPVQKVFLSGGTALMAGIAPALAEELGLTVEVINPFSAIDIKHGSFDAAYLNRVGPMMMVSAGLALRNFG